MNHRLPFVARRHPCRALAAAVMLATVALAATGCQPRPEARDRPVLLVHGWSLTGGTDCGGTWNEMIAQMRQEGFTGPIITLGFYDGDTNCDVDLRSWGSFSNGSSWKDISKALSSYVYATYTSRDQSVDVVGYSMGGNIVRGAVYGAQIGESGFSAPIRVEDGVTLGSPHDGAALFSSVCLWGQCSTMKPGAADITWLNRDGNPQGPDGTEWTVFGSDADSVVPADSALHMDLPDGRKIRYPDVPHTGGDNYMGRPYVVTRADDALARPDS